MSNQTTIFICTKNQLYSLFIITILTFFVVSFSSAAPTINSISGSIYNGGTIDISGSFGSMGGSVVSWDDFEAHNTGIDLSTRTLRPIIGPNWTTFKLGSGVDPVAINSQRAHSGSKSVIVDWGDTTINSFGWAGQGPFDRLYITYWRYQEGNFSASTCNHKQFFLYGNNDQMPQNLLMIPAGTSTWGMYNNVGDPDITYRLRFNLNKLGWSYSTTANRFQRWEFFTQLNSPHTESNGIIKMWVDGQLGIENYAYRSRYVDGEFIDFRLGHMAQGFNSSARAWFDDLYIATTQARVEIGNNASFNNCTHREIQVPTSWSNGSISFTVNQGNFSPGQTAYLFVVDSAGDASPGYPITIGQSGSGSIGRVIYNPPTPTPTPEITPIDNVTNIWTAETQTGDSNWKNSVVTYCVRLLVEKEYIDGSGNSIVLGFQGRGSGDYTIRKVSIAVADENGGQGDVIDTTWTRVTFDGKNEDSWVNDSTVIPENTVKFSDPITFEMNNEKDYYVTFKIESPSVYLNPAESYRELYFENEDHTEDIDWSQNGHGLTYDYHALAAIIATIPLPTSDVYGLMTGAKRVANEVDMSFSGGLGDVTITYEAYDVDYADEIEILINDEHVGYVKPTENNSWGMEVIVIPDEYVNDDSVNILTFNNTYNPPNAYVWGIRNLSHGIPLPVTSPYGNNVPGGVTTKNEVDMYFIGSSGDITITYEAYDVDFADEIEIFINDEPVGYAQTTGNDAWGTTRSILLPNEYVKDNAINILTFSNTYNPPNNYKWGVRNVSR